ncbi:MAG: LamG domain-containing protein, partial [Candidatus Aenigmatarchaeota archaeon]
MLLLLCAMLILSGEPTGMVTTVNFTSDMPGNATEICKNEFQINISAASAENLSQFIFSWNTTNYVYYNESLVLMMNLNNISEIGDSDVKAMDLSRYQNNGTLNGAVYNASGVYGKSVYFDGMNDNITIPNSASLNLQGPLSVEAWVYPIGNDAGPAYYYILSKESEYSNGYGLTIYITDAYYMQFYTAQGEGYPYEARWNFGPTTSIQNRWFYVVGVFNGTHNLIYINGTLKGSVVAKASGSTAAYPLVIGHTGRWQSAAELNFSGNIDEVRIWNRTLNATEIRQYYTSNLYKYDTNNWTFYSNQTNLTNSTYTYYGYSEDVDGNKNQTDVRTLIVSHAPPRITIVSPSSLSYQTRRIEFNVSLNKAGSWCGFSINNSANITMARVNDTYFNYTNASMPDGDYNVTFSCNNTIGIMNTTHGREFWVSIPPPTTTTQGYRRYTSTTEAENTSEETSITESTAIYSG